MLFKNFLVITRAWSFSITFVAISLGTIVASQDTRVSWPYYFLCLLGAFLFHGGANTLNDYYDLKKGIDTPGSPTALYRPHPVFTHLVSQQQLFRLSILLLTISSGIAITLAAFRSPWIWAMLPMGLIFAFSYTGGPNGLKYIALGEPLMFLAFGPLMIEGAYTVQSSTLSLKALVVSLPFGLLVSLVLLANNLRDIEFDRLSGIKTIGTLLGRRRTLLLFSILSYLPFLLVALLIFKGVFSWPALSVFLSLPQAIKINTEFNKAVPISADAQTSQLTFSFGILLGLALLASGFLLKS